MAFGESFLKIDGIEGESTDARHKGEIEVESWSFGASSPVSSNSSAGVGVGKVSLRELSLVKKTDAASVKLFLACCTGQHLKTATLACRSGANAKVAFMVVQLSDIVVSGFATGASAVAGEDPKEQVTIHFSRIMITYTPQKPDGSPGTPVNGGWDQAANKKL